MKFREACSLLKESGVEDFSYSAREIFIHIGGMDVKDLLIGDAECDLPALSDALERRAKGEPLQYILGFADFYRERYTVTPACLIPRSDTELLVDIAVKSIPEGERFADLCTGSGCVGISTLKNTKNTRAVLADISSEALAVAEKNSIDNGVFERVELLQADLLRELPEGEFFAFLSNPPYVSESAYGGLSREIYSEPEIAFVGGVDGADFYRSFTPRLKEKIKDGGFIAYEIGYDQADILRKIAEDNSLRCEIFKDLSGNDRVAVLRK